jgi:Carboxypeptidase regulatory-like domain
MPSFKSKVAMLSLGILLCGIASRAHSQEPPVAAGTESGVAGASATDASTRGPLAEPQSSGSIRGSVVDRTGNIIVGACVKLTRDDASQNQEVSSDGEGEFFLSKVAPGLFQLTITLPGFATQTISGVLSPGEVYTVPQTTLAIAAAITEVRVVPNIVEVAEDEIKEQEKQRVLGVIPNFYVSYVSNAAPLSPKQKFELAWKTSVDPVTFGLTGATAGIQQAQNDFSGYGQGAQGYAKRYGASYANLTIDTFIGGAILPSLFKQDPRYFYKGTGSTRSRILYAIANAVICKGDNKRWQANYSGILGGLAAGGISNLYYPAQDRNGAALTFENALIGIGESAAANILQEFVVRRLTPSASKGQQAQP